MTESTAVSRSTQPDVVTLQWLALVLTPGMGPIRGHRVVQHFGGIERACAASLTELEAIGLPAAAAAQSIALNKSYSLAEEEFMKARDWEELPNEVKLQLEATWRVESPGPNEASVFSDSQLSPHEKRIYALLKPDEATQLDVIIEKLEGEISSPEIFSALFELELAGEIKPLPGKNYVRSF